jgi:hypothetical protein
MVFVYWIMPTLYNYLEFSMFTDMICCFVELVVNPPWTARTSSGQTVKFIDGKWKQIEDSELMKLTKLEGQV